MIQPNGWARLPQSAALIIALLVALLLTTVALAQPPTPRIVGGQEADPGEWPWQVALVKKGPNLYNNQFCGGMLIAANWVVTAAHCVDTEGPNDLDVVAGVHDLANPGANIQRRTLSQIIVHPNWNPTNGDSDIALLKLTSPIAERPASAGILPIRYIALAPTNVGDLAGRKLGNDSIRYGGRDIQIEVDDKRTFYGVGVSPNISRASIEALFSAVNRAFA